MTKADEFVAELDSQGTGKRNATNAAHHVDSTNWTFADVDDKFRFYYFSDGSVSGTVLRLRPLQYWAVPSRPA